MARRPGRPSGRPDGRADIGDRRHVQLSAIVKAKNLPPVYAGGGSVAAPTNLTLPSITGTAQVGQTLTRVNGTWSGAGTITYAHQWLANGVAISGATAATYVPVVGDVGKTITSRTTASNAGGSTSVTSAPTSAVIAATATVTVPGAPTITLGAGAGQVTVTWTDGAANGATITSHKLYRGTVAGTRTLVGTISTASPYIDAPLAGNTAYFYTLSAVNSAGEGPQSAEVSVTTLPLNLSAGAAPRVGITDASYWTRTGGTLSRTTDTGYETNLKNSSTSKTVPFPSSQIPAGSIGYVSIKHDAVTADVSPPLFINWDGNATLPSTASPLLPTVWFSADSTDGSPDSGTWTQDTSFAPFRPSSATDAAYIGRGQRYFWPTAAARWVQVRWDVTVSGATQNVTPHVCCSSGQWMWIVGMSIIRNMHTNISGYNSGRTAVIAAVPNSDPFFFMTARSGANQSLIKSEQVDVVLASPTLKKFIRAIYADTWVNDIAYVSQNVRPYSVAATNGEATLIRNRSDAIFTALKGLNTVVVAPDCSFLNFTSADATANANPYVNSDFQSPNGAFPYNQNVFGPAILANIPGSWDTAFGMPFCSDYAGIAEKFETDTPYATGDSVHPNGTGSTNWRPRRAPLDRLMYGQAAGQNTLQTRLAALGSSTTAALKSRLQAVFDATFAMYPVSAGSDAQTNRSALRAQLDAISVP